MTTTFDPVAESLTAPASPAQARLWLNGQIAGGEPLHSVGLGWRVRGTLDLDALGQALNELCRRQGAVRTSLQAVDGVLVQHVLPEVRIHLEVIDIAAGVDQADATASAARSFVGRPFDLARAPLFRAAALRLAPDDVVLIFAFHHAVFDGLSAGVFRRELEALYEAAITGSSVQLPPLPLQYVDYARAEVVAQAEAAAQAERESDLAYWRDTLDGVPPWIRMPQLRERPAASRAAGYLARSVGEQTRSALRDLTRSTRCTEFMVLMSAFAVTLRRFCGGEALRLATVSAGRRDPRTAPLIGMFVNTLLLPFRFEPTTTFRDLVRECRFTLFNSLAHEATPLGDVLDALEPGRDRTTLPLQATFSLHDASDDTLRLSGFTTEPYEIDVDVCEADLALTVIDRGDRLECGFDFRRELVPADWVGALARCYTETLAQVAAAPEIPLDTLDPTGPQERAAVLDLASGSGAAPAADNGIDTLFRACARNTPDAIAVRSLDGDLTYSQLDRWATGAAHALAAAGVGPGDVVAVCSRPEPRTVAGLLAVLRLGAAYLPIDPDHPAERRELLYRDAGAKAVLGPTDARALVPGIAAESFVEIEQAAPAADPAPLVSRDTPDGTAYVLHTSGSTGRPKGIAVTHRSAVSMLLGADLRIGPDTTFLLLSPLSFDPSVIELWGTLLHGGTVALAPRRLAFLEQPVPILRALHVTAIVLIPQQFNLIVDRDPCELTSLRTVLVGGDVVSPDHVRRALAALPGLQVAHCYGPTENTVLTTLHWVDAVPDGALRLTLGRPTPTTRVYVLDDRLRPVARGAVGELYVGGGQVALGYQGKPRLTAEFFIADPFAPTPGARMYRTGDRVRMDAMGALEFLGRVDEQLALRGFRVEPGEVEAALCSLPQVRAAVVRAAADRLVGYVVPVRWPAEPDLERRVLEHARRTLPAYLVPTVLVPLERLPLNAHGKPDRAALPEPVFRPTDARPPEPPADALEAQLLTIWRELLGRPLHDPDADFFAVGGTSLLALRLSALVEAHTGGRLPLGTVFEARTVRETARALRAPATLGRPTPLDLSAPGPGHTVVCLHPVGGSVECYRELATLLADRHHVFGLPDPALSAGQPTGASLPERASALAAALAERQEPPYVLVGWSFGALLAYQIAAAAPVGAVRRVVLLDPSTADGAKADGAPHVDEELEQLIRREVSEPGDAGPDPAAAGRLRPVYRANIVAGREYLAPRTAVDLTVVLAAQGRTDQEEAAAFWRGRTSGTVEVGMVSGDHFEVLTGSGLAAVARVVRAAWTD